MLPCGGYHSSGSTVTSCLKRPTRELRRTDVVHLAMNTSSVWSCSGWGLPSQPVARTAGELLPHRFTLTASVLPHWVGGLLSVALSVGSPRLAVSQHPVLWSPDFPPRIITDSAR